MSPHKLKLKPIEKYPDRKKHYRSPKEESLEKSQMRVFKAVLNGLRDGGKKESSFLESLLDEESKQGSGRRSFLPQIRM